MVLEAYRIGELVQKAYRELGCGVHNRKEVGSQVRGIPRGKNGPSWPVEGMPSGIYARANTLTLSISVTATLLCDTKRTAGLAGRKQLLPPTEGSDAQHTAPLLLLFPAFFFSWDGLSANQQDEQTDRPADSSHTFPAQDCLDADGPAVAGERLYSCWGGGAPR